MPDWLIIGIIVASVIGLLFFDGGLKLNIQSTSGKTKGDSLLDSLGLGKADLGLGDDLFGAGSDGSMTGQSSQQEARAAEKTIQEQSEEIAELKERIEVLERIVTDKQYELNEQIRNL